MANTTNFGWETPDDTDLVKDGAAAMRTLGNSIDASFVDLKGGTTGQILSKNSNTDLDYAWINNDQGDITSVVAGVGMTGGGTSGAVTLTNDMASTITASGDIVVGTGSGTYDNLPIGSTGQVLTADTTVSPYKVKWATSATTFVGCSLVNSGTQNITDVTTTTINWDTENFDTDAFHSTSSNTNRITIPSGKAGKYFVMATFTYSAGNGGLNQRSLFIRKNGTIYKSDYVNSSNSTVICSNRISTIMDLAVGDYIDVAVYINAGATLTGYPNSEFGQFNVQFLGA